MDQSRCVCVCVCMCVCVCVFQVMWSKFRYVWYNGVRMKGRGRGRESELNRDVKCCVIDAAAAHRVSIKPP